MNDREGPLGTAQPIEQRANRLKIEPAVDVIRLALPVDQAFEVACGLLEAGDSALGFALRLNVTPS